MNPFDMPPSRAHSLFCDCGRCRGPAEGNRLADRWSLILTIGAIATGIAVCIALGRMALGWA